MIPTVPSDYCPSFLAACRPQSRASRPLHAPPADDSRPRFFLDDAFDAGTDGDWWLDLGGVALPTAPAV